MRVGTLRATDADLRASSWSTSIARLEAFASNMEKPTSWKLLLYSSLVVDLKRDEV